MALPPMSAPRASVQASVGNWKPAVRARLESTGIMVAAKGMLSTTAEATADIHRMMGMTTSISPPETSAMKLARTTSTPVSSRPPTVMKRPTKNTRVRQSTRRNTCPAWRNPAISVRAAAMTPISATEMPVCACVTRRTITSRKMPVFVRNKPRSVMASPGSGKVDVSTSAPSCDFVRTLRKAK